VGAPEDLLTQAGIYDKAKAPIKGNGAAPLPLIQSIEAFVASFEVPEYVIAGILQRRFIYALTGLPGAGKTAIMLSLATHVALGRNISPEHEVEKGRVLYLVVMGHKRALTEWGLVRSRISIVRASMRGLVLWRI